jgi:hypothetical protein
VHCQQAGINKDKDTSHASNGDARTTILAKDRGNASVKEAAVLV